MVVRHPILRFISGYKDIVLAKNHRDMLQVPQNAESLSKQQGISLIGAYSLFVINSTNVHFLTFNTSCNLCAVDYNAIVKIDDTNGTSDFFTKSRFVSSQSKQLFQEAKSSQSNTNRKASATWKTLLEQMEFHILERLLEYYRNDFILFNYKLYTCDTSHIVS